MQRLSFTFGLRRIGGDVLEEAGAANVAVGPRLEASPARVTFHLDVGPGGRLDAPPDVRRRAAEEHLETLPSRATWI